MPIPREYQRAADDFSAFLEDIKSAMNSPTRNTAYTTVQAVFIVFRKRLTIEQAIAFASVLPAVLRAIFVQDWNTAEARREFLDLDAMNAEVKAVRQAHNFSPEDAIEQVAAVMWRHVDRDAFRKTLTAISPEALAFWDGATSERNAPPSA